MKQNIALVILSGGQDSVTCLGLALSRHEQVAAITFDYGQRHAVELHCAHTLCHKHKVTQKEVNLRVMKTLVDSALLTTADKWDVKKAHPDNPQLPASFVPGRNALFLTLSHAYAQTIGAAVVYGGMCQTDYSGYPDCREEFVHSFWAALNLGYEKSIELQTPLMRLTKGMTFALADKVGFLDEVLEFSHTCYEGDHSTKQPWGYGCGTCPACQLRAKGWEEFRAHRDSLIANHLAAHPEDLGKPEAELMRLMARKEVAL